MNPEYTIVYIEDNAGDVLLLEQAFQEQSISVIVQNIATGEQALRYLKVKESAKDAPPPDLILVDRFLPQVGGETLVQHIVNSNYLHKIPWFLFVDSNDVKESLIPKSRCLKKPQDWDAYLALSAQLGTVMQNYRSHKKPI